MIISYKYFKLNKRVNSLEESENFAKIEYNNIYRTIDVYDDKIAREIESIYRTIDSRVDKLDDRLSKEDHAIYSAIDDLERRLSTNK